MWETDFKDYTRDAARPINIEDNVRIMSINVPTSIFRRYWERRMMLTNAAHKELIELYQTLEKETEFKSAKKEKLVYIPQEVKDMSVEERKKLLGRLIRFQGKLSADE